MRLAIYLPDLKIDDVGTTLEEFMRGLVVALKRFNANTQQASTHHPQNPFYIKLPDEPFLLKFFRLLNVSCLSARHIEENLTFFEFFSLNQAKDKRILKVLDLLFYLFTSELTTSIPAEKAIDLLRVLFVEKGLINALDIESLFSLSRDSRDLAKVYRRSGFRCAAGQGLLPDRAYFCLDSLAESVASSSSMCISAILQSDGSLAGTIHQVVLPGEPVGNNITMSALALTTVIGRFFPKINEVKV